MATRFDPGTATGNFRIAASDFLAELLMPPLGDLLHRNAPGLRAEFVDLVPHDFVASLEHRNAEIALVHAQLAAKVAASLNLIVIEPPMTIEPALIVKQAMRRAFGGPSLPHNAPSLRLSRNLRSQTETPSPPEEGASQLQGWRGISR
jgi:DNA-binding transcriptional LysR family regulator